MSHTYTRIFVHCVFSTKGRLPLINNSFQERLYQYIGAIIKEYDGIPIKINGTTNHLHVLLAMPSNRSIAEIMRIIKTNSSRWINNLPDVHHGFEWQIGYGAFGVSNENLEDLIRYIVGQEIHHRRVSFKDELVELLRTHGVDYHEQYLWD